jgi:hypothetical protein
MISNADAPDPTPTSPRTNRSILILGMHRSGTSALTRALNMMGAYVGETEDLLPAHPIDNPSGYWERIQLVVEHDRFLAECGHAWDKLANFDVRRIDAECRENLAARLKGILGGIATPDAPLLFKDPRLCVLLPIWHTLLDEPVHIVAVRDPCEIAASLLESHRGTYTSHFLLALWEKYLRAALEELRGRQALFVSYSRLLTEPAIQSSRLLDGLKQFGVSLHETPAAELSSFLDPTLRRSAAKPHMQLNSGQQALYSWLDAQCLASGPVQVADFPQSPAPDAELREFEKALHDQAEQSRAATLSEVAVQIAKLESTITTGDTQLLDMLISQQAQIEQIQTKIDLLESEATLLRHQSARSTRSGAA